jgi:hypothetical protein
MTTRRYFIWLSLLAGSVATVPVIVKTRLNSFKKPLNIPDALSHFCDEESIRKIGNEYLAKFPSENDKKILKELIATGKKGTSQASAEINTDDDQLDKKIKEEFELNDIIIIDGWVLTATEARQCALLSLSKRKS